MDELAIDKEKFRISDKWLHNFCRRHNLGNRSVTHRGQQDNRPAAELCSLVKDYLHSAQIATAGLASAQIFNMDETPCFFDMCSDQTIHFRGEKNVDGVDTGHRKSRFTAVLLINADGATLKTMIIFKGLKKVPKMKCPKNIIVKVAMKGSMNTPLMKEWGKECFSCRGNYLAKTKSLLLMDSYGSHLKPEIIEFFRKDFKTEILQIPPKTTSFLQPLDVAINGPFKAALRREWEAWLAEGPKQYTKKGYRKRPGYKEVVDMVSNAISSLKREAVQKSFVCCGISSEAAEVARDDLNSRLKSVLSVEEEGVEELNSEANEGGSDDEQEEVIEVEVSVQSSGESSEEEYEL